MAYAAKYATADYGPFREAAGPHRSSAIAGVPDGSGGPREAISEVAPDLEEGADMVMVKPALAYLDILLHKPRERFPGVPLAAYNVSGEYSMVKAAAERGWLDGERAMEEALIAIKRAGADWILTYAAKDLARSLGR